VTAYSTLHPLLRNLPHMAFKTTDLDHAIDGASLLRAPYEPIPGVRWR